VSSPFTEPEFIAALYQKLCELRVGANKAGDHSIYSALQFYRYWAQERAFSEEMVAGTQGALRERLQTILDDNNAHYQKCEELLTREALRIFRTDDLVANRRLSAVFNRNVRREKSSYKRLDWPECFCAVTLQSLIKGKVPTKKEVREAATREMAVRLLPAGAGEQAIRVKIKALRKYEPKRPRRIFTALGLTDLEEATSRPGKAYRY
jgi:hypothetical protein